MRGKVEYTQMGYYFFFGFQTQSEGCYIIYLSKMGVSPCVRGDSYYRSSTSYLDRNQNEKVSN